MKKIFTAIAVLCVICPTVCYASYVIHLKDGRAFATEQYVEEGDQIKFKRYGGIIGIEKDLVREIEVVETVEELPDEKVSPSTPDAAETGKREGEQVNEKAEKTGNGNRAKKEDEAKQPPQQGADKKNQGIDVTQYKHKKKELMARYEAAKKKLNDAVLRNDKQARWEAKKEMKQVHAALAELIREVKLASGGRLPDWWHEPTTPGKQDH